MGYLVISLRIGDRLKIGDNIEILISDCYGHRADVAIDAPRTLPIKRIPTRVQEEFKNANHARTRTKKR